MNKTSLLLTGILLAGLGLRLLFIAASPDPDPFTWHGDAVQYDTIAWNLVHGQGFSLADGKPTVYRGPTYPLFLALSYTVFGHNFTAVYVLQAVMDMAACLLLFFIARRVIGDPSALIACSLYAVFPGLIGYTKWIMTETLSVFLLAASIFFLTEAAARKKTLLYALAGVFLGLATLTKPVNIYLPFFLAGTAMLVNRSYRGLAPLLVFALCTYAVVAPWTIRNRSVVPDRIIPVATGSGYLIWIAAYLPPHIGIPPTDDPKYAPVTARLQSIVKDKTTFDPEIDVQLAADGKKEILARPLAYAVKYFKRIPILWLSGNTAALYLYPNVKSTGELMKASGLLVLLIVAAAKLLSIALLLLAGLGAYLIFRQGYGAGSPLLPALLLATVAYYTLFHCLITVGPRFVLPVWPYVFVFSAAGAHFLFVKFRPKAGTPT